MWRGTSSPYRPLFLFRLPESGFFCGCCDFKFHSSLVVLAVLLPLRGTGIASAINRFLNTFLGFVVPDYGCSFSEVVVLFEGHARRSQLQGRSHLLAVRIRGRSVCCSGPLDSDGLDFRYLSTAEELYPAVGDSPRLCDALTGIWVVSAGGVLPILAFWGRWPVSGRPDGQCVVMIGIMKSSHGILLVIFSLAAFGISHLVEAQNQEETKTDIQFLSDENFIQSGKMGRIPADLESENLKPYSNLRYFPDGIRNCYDIRVEIGKKYLVRAMVFYGNFDGLNVSPEFDMYIGPNKWTNIDLQKEPSGSCKEIIHIPRSNSLQICLVKTGATTPMISTLELRPLANDTYLAISSSLKLNFRMYLSNSAALLRYVFLFNL
ncbi:hypothetical protein Bca4012_026448 [Brassica carinata]|uniref:Malectin-like domain-containing protein n=1 Tax=Brassica carinata TaxID=52824 RepID=A0A8X8AUN1_BRACI|nr:hypothetical protein Bca52824_023490 [Brassica carinata]